MKKCIWILVWFLVATPCWANWGDPLPPGLIELVDRPTDKSVCRCEYYKSPNYGQLIFTRGCDLDAPKHALMKIDGAAVKLTRKSDSQDASDCKRGAPFKQKWSAPGIEVTIKGVYTGSGEESCWIKGSVTVIKGSKKQTMLIEGACGI